jgi:hypothetical protein
MKTTATEIYKLYERKTEKPREYLGWSQIGRPCERELWLAFRWAFNNTFEGRMLRLFDTGHREEARIIHELRELGCEVKCIDPATGKQYGTQALGGHFRGHLDAIVTGLPEDEQTTYLVDVKTVKSKKFDQLLKDGIKKLYPEYWAQAHGYMGEFKLARAMYIFVCKDDERIHSETFDFDPAVHQKYLKRAEAIIFADRMPPPISTDPSWYQCGYCSAKDICHGSKLTKNVNCRTCAHSTAERDGSWSCAHYGATIPDSTAQLSGCPSHILHPDLTPWKYSPTEHGVVWHTPDGDINNGESSFDTFESTEIVVNPKACASGDRFVEDMREMFGARVVG